MVRVSLHYGCMAEDCFVNDMIVYISFCREVAGDCWRSNTDCYAGPSTRPANAAPWTTNPAAAAGTTITGVYMLNNRLKGSVHQYKYIARLQLLSLDGLCRLYE